MYWILSHQNNCVYIDAFSVILCFQMQNFKIKKKILSLWNSRWLFNISCIFMSSSVLPASLHCPQARPPLLGNLMWCTHSPDSVFKCHSPNVRWHWGRPHLAKCFPQPTGRLCSKPSFPFLFTHRLHFLQQCQTHYIKRLGPKGRDSSSLQGPSFHPGQEQESCVPHAPKRGTLGPQRRTLVARRKRG